MYTLLVNGMNISNYDHYLSCLVSAATVLEYFPNVIATCSIMV